jgi:hypothetical protein
MQRIQVQLFVPGAGNTKCCISSGTRGGVFPLAEPSVGFLEPLSKEGEVVRHGLPRPQELEDLEGDFRQLVKMPVDDPHVCDPGITCNQVIISVPGSLGVSSTILNPQLGDLGVRVRLGLRKELWEKRKRELYKDTPLETQTGIPG